MVGFGEEIADFECVVCKMPILTDDYYESEDTLFMRRSEVSLPEGCWDTTLGITSQGMGGH